tara:strand:- start:210 stop:731 length:522 start_codon:yes stop_codon:yes gene_type:complete
MKNNLKQDKKAKSISFFFKKEAEVFNKKHILFLEKYYKKNNKDIRICLHTTQKDKHHDMIILQQKKNFYPPHKHLKKGETYHIIKGSMVCILFSNSGKILRTYKLKKNDIFRTPVNKFHTMFPLTKFVIYHESKTGPFLKKKDSIFSEWSKKLTKDQTHINEFKKRVINFLKK